MKQLFLTRTNSTAIQFFRYVIVGGSSTVVHFAIYFFLTRQFEMYYLTANILAFVGGFIWNYITSVLWIFSSKYSRRREVTSVLAIALMGLFLNQLLLFIQVDLMHINDMLALVIATGIVMWWNFGMRKLLVFH